LELSDRINVFSELGSILKTYASNERQSQFGKYYQILDQRTARAQEQNPWFTEENIRHAFISLAEALQKSELEHWISLYPELKKQVNQPLKIGVVNAGNIPFVGFHDFISILITGHIYLGKLSSKDKEIPIAIREILTDIEPKFNERIHYTEERLSNFDAIIATGSDNTSRYFEYYFSRYPHIIRKNRNSAAVITGKESDAELKKLADDIFLYFGLGCRNVSKIYFPQNFPFNRFFENINHYESTLRQHHKYLNNYEYNRTIFLMNKIKHLDNGFVLLRENTALSSPIGTLYYEMYSDIQKVRKELDDLSEKIQCIVSDTQFISDSIPFGSSQSPRLWDYADHVDTVQFILSLAK
jgi:hypothetical protein